MGHKPYGDSQRQQRAVRSGSGENKLIDQLSRGDYNDHSDYNGGLDDEHSDIDFAEVSDYFKD